MSKPEVDAFLLGLRKVFTNVTRLPMPTIACLDGLAMGGGLELALTCDLRIAGPAATKLGLTETKLGIIPGAGGTSRMTRLVGPAKTKELVFSAKLVDAVEACRIGFVDMVAQEGDGSAAFMKGVQLARAFAKNGKSRGINTISLFSNVKTAEVVSGIRSIVVACSAELDGGQSRTTMDGPAALV